MTDLQALEARHTVRSFTGQPLTADQKTQIEQLIEQLNEKYQLNMVLKTNDSSAFNALLKATMAKKADNFIVLAGVPSATLRERLGYASSILMMEVQKMGLNSWWVGGTFSRGKVEKEFPDLQCLGILVIGYGTTQGKMHKSKKFEDVADYEGKMPQWFINGVNAALLAPTALNKQGFHISGHGSQVNITGSSGVFGELDLGIVKHHFRVGAGSENFSWEKKSAV